VDARDRGIKSDAARVGPAHVGDHVAGIGEGDHAGARVDQGGKAGHVQLGGARPADRGVEQFEQANHVEVVAHEALGHVVAALGGGGDHGGGPAGGGGVA